jgi:RimJ/RimL family protein N-acetyltransferase
MTKKPVEFRAFDVATASAEELAAAHALDRRLSAEMWPDDPPPGFEEWIRELRAIPPYVLFRQWGAWHGGEAVGRAFLVARDTPQNRHLANTDIWVAPEWRRQGIAKRFLSHIVEAANALDRTLLVAGTDSSIPAGRAFMERLGARVGIVERTNQLDLARLDPALMQAWREEGPRDEYELGWWLGPYPDEDLAAICNLMDVMNTAPRGDLEVEDWSWTPEMVRQQEASMLERKVERWTLFTRHRASGELAGYTEVSYDPSQSETLYQGDTGVVPQHRGHGLGRWLKATMIERVLAERPQVKRVRTGNANSNAPMLRINEAMGFRPYKDWTIWQIEVATVRDYVART